MKVSDMGVRLIKHYEKLRLVGYTDSAGVWTIGWGSTGRVKGPERITSARATEWLSEDIRLVERALNSMITTLVCQCEFDALASWVFNVGETNARRSTLIRLLNAGENRKLVAAELLRWNRITLPDGTKKSLKGLTSRREAERHLFLRGRLNFEPSPRVGSTSNSLPDPKAS
jgi:lysozyme